MKRKFFKLITVVLFAVIGSITTLTSADDVDPTVLQFLGATPTNAELFNSCLDECDFDSVLAATASTLAYSSRDDKDSCRMIADPTMAPLIGKYETYTQIFCEDGIARAFVATKIMGGEKVIIVAFRGTADRSDWFSDAECFREEFTSCGHKLHGHKGVCGLFRQMEPQIHCAIEEAKKNGGTRIVTTGHSLGGGVAVRFALYAKDKNPEMNLKLYTFSSMSFVGWQSHADEITAILGDENIVRFDPENDSVPDLGCGVLCKGVRVGTQQRCLSFAGFDVPVVGKKDAHALNYHCADLQMQLIDKYNKASQELERQARIKRDQAVQGAEMALAARDEVLRIFVKYQQKMESNPSSIRRGEVWSAERIEQWKSEQLASVERQIQYHTSEYDHFIEERRKAEKLLEIARKNWAAYDQPNFMELTMKREVKSKNWEPFVAALLKNSTNGYGGNIPSQEGRSSERLEKARRILRGS